MSKRIDIIATDLYPKELGYKFEAKTEKGLEFLNKHFYFDVPDMPKVFDSKAISHIYTYEYKWNGPKLKVIHWKDRID